MAGVVGNGRDEMAAATSTRNKVKFLCSHGGKIVPRPPDCQLKYVGGETRVIAVPRDIKFSELMKKLTELIDGDIVLKYQLISEELDALVSVRSDEDLKHMVEEYDRLESEGSPRLRVFLFPSNAVAQENQPHSLDPHTAEKRYVDAINGIVRSSSTKLFPHHHAMTISSACSSPKSSSPDGQISDSMVHESISLSGFMNSRLHHQLPHDLHKVRSTPSLCSLNNNVQYRGNSPTKHKIPYHQFPYHCYQNHHHHQRNGGYQSFRPSPDHNRSEMTMGKAETGKSQMSGGHVLNHLPTYLSGITARHQRGSGSGCCKCNRYCFHDECGGGHGCCRSDKVESVPRSPRRNIWE